ncbi:T9SS type B sorting domain-containing protein [Sinomicrobium soli]|uniref:T9SS type B sorting domain-containing protein n=1 Tax=Sinomicrobium sp. N-1-3-6 TaxID=2219864 RepID=UPI0013750166|nr:gliding motility-associated C-terminal domain-containing protein [Sinomicrobium sp. N-1-3-6]
MKRSLLRFYKKYLSLLLLLGVTGPCFSQIDTFSRPELQFNSPCASPGFNVYRVRFMWDYSQAVVTPDNEFILELSDEHGDFSDPVELDRVSDKNDVFDFEFEFGFPGNTAGDAYRVRVRSTDPVAYSRHSDPFPAYFLHVNSQLTINVIDGFVQGEVVLCSGGQYELSVHNYPGESAYIWYRNGAEIPGEKNASLVVTQPGTYMAEVDYGEYCSQNTSSNMVAVTLGSSLVPEINGGAPLLEICSPADAILTADTDNSSYTYTWFKDGVQTGNSGYYPELILDEPDPSGTYSLKMTAPGGCEAMSDEIEVSIPDFAADIAAPGEVLLLPGDTYVLQATTTASDPVYTWYRNNTVMNGEHGATLTVNGEGVYKVKILQGTGCPIEKYSGDITVSEPQGFEISISAEAGYTPCEDDTATLKVSGIWAVSGSGASVDVFEQYKDIVNYQWYRNGNFLDGRTGSTMTIDQPSDNGAYSLKMTYLSDEAVSDVLEVRLKLQETVSIEASDDILCGGAIAISITTGTGNTDYTYAWYKNGEKISENTDALDIEEEGRYRLGVSAYGCTVFSNELNIHPFDETRIQVDAPERIIIPEGSSRTVTASGGDSYQWYNDRDELLSGADSVTVSAEGRIRLYAYIGSCEISREFTVAFQDSYVIPNLVSPNNDGINDFWVLPNIYAFNPDIEVVIYAATGAVMLQTTSYQNNWPESSLAYTQGKPVFYYRILREGKEVIRQGTITVIR